MFKKFFKIPPDEKGQGLVEYALILVLVAVVAIAVLLILGPSVGNVFSKVVTVLQLGGSSGVIVSATPVVDTPGGIYRLTVNVTVSTPSNVTLSSDGKTDTVNCNLTCAPKVTNVPSSGSFTVTAAAGGSLTGSY